MKRRRTTIKGRLGDLTNALYSSVYNMTPRQRSAAIRVLEGLTGTNCGWTLYRLRNELRQFIDDASSLRERKARERSRTRRELGG